MERRLKEIFWKEGKIIDSQGNDITEKARGIEGMEEVILNEDKHDFEDYVLVHLNDLKKTDKIYETVNSYIILNKSYLPPRGTLSFGFNSAFSYKFQYSQV